MTTICTSAADAVADVEDGSTLLVSGFGMAGMPALLASGRVHRMICSFPRQADS
jgi:3-oxoadipate CoA-transferase, alpha subunit